MPATDHDGNDDDLLARTGGQRTDRDLVNAAIGVCIMADIVPLMWGDIAVGKTETAKAIAEYYGLVCEVVLLSIRRPDEVAGVQGMNRNERTGRLFTEHAMPDWAESVIEHDGGIVFFDELTTATPMVSKAGLRIIDERTVGRHRLPAATRMLGGANPPEIAADGYDLTAPLANRFAHFDMPNPPEGWIRGMLTGSFPIPLVPKVDQRDADAALPGAVNLVVSYIERNRSALHQRPADPVAAGRAWPSNRTWKMLTRGLAVVHAAGLADDHDLVQTLAAGCVGTDAGLAFSEYARNLDLPDPEALLADPASFDQHARDDQAFATLTSVASAVAADLTVARWMAAWQMVEAVVAAGKPHIAIWAAEPLVAQRARLVELADGEVPPFPPALAALLPAMRAAEYDRAANSR